jgi:hypothetical protein
MFRFQMAGVGLFHDDDAGVVPELPGELAPANVHGKNLCRAVLQQTIGESAGGRAQVERHQSGDIQLKMAQGMFQFVAAAADVFLVRVQGEPVIGFDGVTGLVGGLSVDANLAGKNGAFGAFAAFTKAAFNQCLVEASHVEAYLTLPLISGNYVLIGDQLHLPERWSGKVKNQGSFFRK